MNEPFIAAKAGDAPMDHAPPPPRNTAGSQTAPDQSVAFDLSVTIPTRLPELLRAISHQASRLAHDPLNALDNNPFIMREWLIISQALHSAAANIEKRFDALFLGV